MLMKVGWKFILTAVLIVFANVSWAGGPHKVKIPNSINYWQTSGFVDMVAPLRLPSDKGFTDIIKVWLKVPEDKKISVLWIESQQRYSLVYPNGTITDRMESTRDYSTNPISEEIDDVRGARIDENGNTIFHVYEEVP